MYIQVTVTYINRNYR